DAFFDFDLIDCGGDRRGLADSAEVGPGALDIAVSEKQAAHFARALDEGGVVLAARFRGPRVGIVYLDPRPSQVVTRLEKADFKQQRIVFVRVSLRREDIEAGLGSARSQRLIDPVKCVVAHFRFFLLRSGSTIENCSLRSEGSTRSRQTRRRSPIENSR